MMELTQMVTACLIFCEEPPCTPDVVGQGTTLNVSASSSTSVTYDLPPSTVDVTFTVSEIDAKPGRLERVIITATNDQGTTTNLEYIGDATSSATINLDGSVSSVTITLDNLTNERPRGKIQVIVSDLVGCTTSGTTAGTTDVDPGSLIKDDIKVFPNPVQERLTIQTREIYQGGHITLLNTMGQIAKTIPLKDQRKQEIYVDDLASGIYLLRFKPDGHNPLIKQVVIMD